MTDNLTDYKKHRFFDQDFHHGEELWDCMAKFLCIWSGSLALEKFLSGCSDKKSDYDLYCPDNGHAICGMLRTLVRCGVTMTSPLDEMQRLTCTGGKVSLPHWRVKKLVQAFDDSWSERYAETLMHVIIQDLRQASEAIAAFGPMVDNEVVGDKEKRLRTLRWRLQGDKQLIIEIPRYTNGEYDHVMGLQVLRGTTHTGKRVQLIFAPKMTAVEHVLRFHSTAVQCLICPYAAIHFYWDLAERRRAWAWEENTALLTGRVRLDRHDVGIAKYKSRGFTYVPRPYGDVKARVLFGEGTRVDMPKNFPKQYTCADDARRRSISAIGWYEFQKQTRLISAPDTRSLGERAEASELTLSKETPEYVRDVKLLFTKYALRMSDVSWGACTDIIAF